MFHSNALFISELFNLEAMVLLQESKIKRTLIVRLVPGEDILESLESLTLEQEIEGAQISFIGAIAGATLGYFDLNSRTYKSFSLMEDLEVTSGIGNISRLEDGTPIVHAHIVVADESGKSFSGHLMKGCIVSVTIEILINVLEQRLLRTKDTRSGLNLLNLR